MNRLSRLARLGAFLLLAFIVHPALRAQYDPGSRDPEAASDLDAQTKANSKLKAALGQTAPDFSFQASDGKTYRVSDFAGRWLLLQLGASWCPASESTAQYFSVIRKNLEGKPFEFVEIYDDLSLDDAVLHSHTDFRGIRGFAGISGAPEFYHVGYIPVWYLIDPKGVIRLDGDIADYGELQEKIAAVLKEDPRFKDIAMIPSPQDQRYLDACGLTQSRKWKEAEAAWEEVLKEDPTNAYAIAKHTRCIAWTKGYKNACKDLDDKIKALPDGGPDFLKLFLARYQLKGDGKAADGAKTFEAIGAAHPAAKYPAAELIALSKTPDQVSNQEFQNLTEASRFYGDDLGFFCGYVLERKGRMEDAIARLSALKKNRGRSGYPVAGVLHRIGADDQARQILFGKNPPPPETASRAMAWELSQSAALIEDWEKSAAYARRYEQDQPKRGEGPLFQMLAAMRMKQDDKAKEHRARLEQILAANYKSVQFLQGEGPSRDQLMSIGDENVRMVTALSAYLFAQMDGQGGRASVIRGNALNAYPASRDAYALIYGITTSPGEAVFKLRARMAERKEKMKSIRETLDAEDSKLMKALGVSPANKADADTVALYMIGKLSPVYDGLKTSDFFPEMEKYREQLEARFALAAGLKQLDQLPEYCASNNIDHDDLTAFIKGSIINELAYLTEPVSDEARGQYISLTESCIVQSPAEFYSSPYKNWNSFRAFLEKRNAFRKDPKAMPKEVPQGVTSPGSVAPAPSRSSTPQPPAVP